MDVKCERCGTEYEFEETRVTEEGVTVKCSTCGHLFKIRKKSFVLTEPVAPEAKEGDGAAGKNWMVRRPDGTILSFKELTTLQKWIVERKVDRDDEISKSGETWKRLGTIAELNSFFEVVDRATSQIPAATSLPPAPAPAAPAQGTPTTQPLFAAQAQPPAVSAPPQPPAPVPPQAAPAAPAPTAPPQPEPVAPAAPVQPAPAPSMPPQAAPVAPTPVAPAPVQAAPSMPPAAPAAPAEPDSWGDVTAPMGQGGGTGEEDVVEKWKRRGRRKWFIIVPLLLIVAGVGVFYLVAPDRFMELVDRARGVSEETISELARTHHAAGLKHALKDSQAEYKKAIDELDQAVKEAKGAYPEAMAELAEVYITRADRAGERIAMLEPEIEALAKEVKDLKEQAEQKGREKESKELKDKAVDLHNKKVALQKEAATLLKQAQQDMDKAKGLIAGARKADAKAFTPMRAHADYLRVRGSDRAAVEVALKKARKLKRNDPVLVYIDGAVTATDPAALDSAAQKLNQAIDLQSKANKPDLLKARYALARVLMLQKRGDDAKVQLKRILEGNAAHEAAKAMLERLDKPDDEADQGKDGAEGKEPKEGKDGEKDKNGDKDKGKDKAPVSYDGRMNVANRLRDQGRSRQALEAYAAALELKPGDAEALAGKGWCYLDLGSNNAAIASFARALKSNKRYGDAIMGLAESYKFAGKKDKAVIYYKRYLDVLPSGPEAAVARTNLESLK